MLSINKYQMTQQPSFKGKGDNVAKKVLEKAGNMKCKPSGKIQLSTIEHAKLTETEKKAYRVLEDLEVSRILHDPRLSQEMKKEILLARALSTGMLDKLKEVAESMIKKVTSK